MIRPSRNLRTLLNDPSGRDPAEELKHRADRVCCLILTSDYPDVDIDIEIRVLRQWCAKSLPNHLDLFDIVYLNRFRRLRAQFRA